MIQDYGLGFGAWHLEFRAYSFWSATARSRRLSIKLQLLDGRFSPEFANQHPKRISHATWTPVQLSSYTSFALCLQQASSFGLGQVCMWAEVLGNSCQGIRVSLPIR